LVVHAFNLSYSGGRDQEDDGSQVAPANISDNPIWKISNAGLGCNSVVECLPTIHEALGSTPSTERGEKKTIHTKKGWQNG
jgi:hypothetical protein